jgi:predicted AlkP superfamily pyrophosphatase or phosphodiesterase
MKRFHLLPALLLALVLSSCLPVAPADTPTLALTSAASITPIISPTVASTVTQTPAPSPSPFPKAQRVLIISIDGLRPDGLLQSNIPRISALINGGAASYSAQTVFPSVTLPAHASMLSGRCVSKHGITWDDYEPDKGYLQGATIFSVAHDAGMWTVMVVGKEKLETIARPGTVDKFRFISGTDEEIVQAALEESARGFGVLFVHLTYPDSFGHADGWMSATYLSVIGHDDTVVGTLLDGLQAQNLMEGTLIILTADHGGHDQSHGSLLKEDMTIPWIIFGPGVVAGPPLEVPILTTDTAATGVWALGLAIPSDWDGRPVVEAFGLKAESLPVATAAAGRCAS